MTEVDAGSSNLVRFAMRTEHDESGVWHVIIPSLDCQGSGDSMPLAKANALKGLLAHLKAIDDLSQVKGDAEDGHAGVLVNLSNLEALEIYQLGFRIHGARWSDLRGCTQVVIDGRELDFRESGNAGDLSAGHVGLFESESALFSAFRGVPEVLRTRFFLASGLKVHVDRADHSRLKPDGRWTWFLSRSHSSRVLTTDLFEDDEQLNPTELDALSRAIANDRRHSNLVTLAAEAEDFLEKGNNQVSIMLYALTLDTIANLNGAIARDGWRAKLDRVIDLAGLSRMPQDERTEMYHARHHVCHDADCDRPRCFTTSAYLFRKVIRRAITASARKFL